MPSLQTFLSTPTELHAAVGGAVAARHGRHDRVVALAFGEAEPRTPIEENIVDQSWYALAAATLAAITAH